MLPCVSSALAFLAVTSYALQVGDADRQLDRAFLDPPAEYRAFFRYWLPDGSVSPEVVQDDVSSMADVGVGGFELVTFHFSPFAAVGGVNNTTPTDWNKYDFGTPAYNDLFSKTLQAAKKSDLLVDFQVGPNIGHGVPAEPMTEGLAVELLLGNASITAGNAFAGPVPPPQRPNPRLDTGYGFMHPLEQFGTANLTAVMAYKVTKRYSSKIWVPFSQANMTVPTIGLDESSYVDLTPRVKNGYLRWNAPEGDGTWLIISAWERYTNQRSSVGGKFAKEVIGNGTWTVDHFGRAGAKVTTDFWDQHILDDRQTAELLREVGNYAWEDSQEMTASLYWTPNLLSKFRKRHGYSLTKYLPLLFAASNSWNGLVTPYPEQFAFGEYLPDGSSVYNLDYWQTLGEGFQAYMAHFREWAHQRGLKYSIQPAYNLPLQMLSAVPHSDAPECESLAFKDKIDAYRQFSGPAHLQQINVISNEMAAVHAPTYSLTLPGLLFLTQRAWAGGINRVVLHGFPYSGTYPSSTWPGHNPFHYSYTEMWNPYQPCWKHIKDTLDYMGRTQYILQQGKPRVDLAFYLFESPYFPQDLYNSTNLRDLGYSYDYIGPDNLLSPKAFVRDKTLGSDGPAYQALIFAAPVFDTITFNMVSENVARRLIQFAKSGLPIIFVGSPPGETPGHKQHSGCALKDLLRAKNVYFINSADELPNALRKANVLPRVSTTCQSGGVISVQRHDATKGTDYVFFYNDQSTATTCQIQLTGYPKRALYKLDAWTGSKEPILSFGENKDGLNFSLSFQPNQTAIVALHGLQNRNVPHLEATLDKNVASVEKRKGGLIVKLLGPARIKSASGKTWSFDKKPPSPTSLMKWNLSIEDWHASENRSETTTAVTIHNLTSVDLRPWSKLAPGLDAVGGIGRYTTSLKVPKRSAIGGLLNLGPIVHSVRVHIDGKQLPAVDLTGATVDISKAIKPGGTHSLMIEVTTPLFNRIKAEANETMVWGAVAGLQEPRYASTSPREYGLLGPVFVNWTLAETLL